MMHILDGLQPQAVFSFFEELSAIPHGSRHTKAISDWCVAFAKARGLAVRQDGANNVVIVKEAAPGYEQAPTVMLQGHLDMVCEKEPGCAKDMEREGLELATDGSYVWAKGTTLGGDDGIAVAMVLAILDAKDLPHPRLEAVFTTDEEIGMLGAAALDAAGLRSKYLLNLDSEEEGVFTVSCAGGARASVLLPLARAPYAGKALRLTVDGLQGGHSGVEIDKGRANADLLLGRVLAGMQLAGVDFRLVDVAGGLKDNAIPVSCTAVLRAADPAAVCAAAAKTDAAFRAEYQTADPGVHVHAESCGDERAAMDEATTRRVVCLLSLAPNGIQEMSRDIPGLVQTSLNLGILGCSGEQLEASFCLRSSVASQKTMMRERLDTLAALLGGRVEYSGDYPAWEYKKESALRERMTEVYRAQYGKEPEIAAIHAGVECGLFCGKLPGLDCVSFGPELEQIHTPRERMNVASVQRVWAFTLEVLKRLK